MEPLTIFIGGTMAVPLYCLPGAHDCGHAVVKTIPGRGLLSIEESQRLIATWIDQRAQPGQRLVLAGHSQGALHAVLYALDHPNVARVISVSGPHHGTLTALPLAPFVASMRDMSPGSEFMHRYAERLPEIAPRLDSIYLRHDLLIIPHHSAHVDGACNYLFASEEEYGQMPLHISDTERLDGAANHLTELFSRSVRRVLRDVHSRSLGSAA